MSSNSELLDHISKLTNAIQQRRLEQQQTRYPQRPPVSPHASYNRSTITAGRGRGRGSFLPHRHPTTIPNANGSMNKSVHRTTGSPHNKSLVLNNTNQSPSLSPTAAIRPPLPRSQTFLNKTFNNASTSNQHLQRTHASPVPLSPTVRPPALTPHRSLVLNNSSTSKRSRSSMATASSQSSHPPRQSQHKKLIIRHSKAPGTTSTSTSTYNNSAGQKIVVIDGIPFINLGKKLVRQDTLGKTTMATGDTNVGPRVLIRKLVKRRDRSNNLVLRKQQPVKTIKRHRLDRKGNAVYIRKPEGYEQKGINGNTLILKNSLATTRLHRKKPSTASTYCGTFTRYGTCPNGTHCRFLHDRNRVAICVGFLMTSSCRNGTRCQLSHAPTPHNTPHCRHFQRMRCSNDPCPFAHVRVRPDAPLCRPFGVEGYCPKGSTCKNLHVIVCPTFAVLGKCTNKRCKFPHVASTAPIKKEDTHTTTDTTADTAIKKSTVSNKKTQWIRPELQASLDQQRKEKKQRMVMEKQQQQQQQTPLAEEKRLADINTNDDGRDASNNDSAIQDDGFVPLFGDDNDDDDAEWNQYLIKNPEDVEEIKCLRFSDPTDGNQEEEQDDDGDDDSIEENSDGNSDGSDNLDEGDFVYEEISDEDMAGDDSSVEEIYEEASDFDDDDDAMNAKSM